MLHNGTWCETRPIIWPCHDCPGNLEFPTVNRSIYIMPAQLQQVRLCWKGMGQSVFAGDAGDLVVLGPVANHRRTASDSVPLQVSLFQGGLINGPTPG